ncbi:hypothetical protein AX14_002087 [Amanita brunnescens Koide BX004]|nr:hypothetical protein AX14_002087 [Amanita brunnescens Koide BX004]
MASDPTGPPGPTRPKTSQSQSASRSHSLHVLSPAPSRPYSSWFQLLTSPSPSPLPLITPAPAVVLEPLQPQPHASLVQTTTQYTCCSPSASIRSTIQTTNAPDNFVDNRHIISNIATDENSHLHLGTNFADPWTRAHMRVCAHAKDACSVCSVSLTCCSCRSLRYTPGLPPASPTHPIQRSCSASPALFRDVGNGTPPITPPGFHANLDYDDDAYARAYAESDTCDNSSCPRGTDEPATWTIIVEDFDIGTEEFYDRTFRACGACNRSCKKTFMTHKIKSRTFDNSTKEAPSSLAGPPGAGTTAAQSTPTPLPPPPSESRPATPLEVFSLVARQHRISCDHLHSVCSSCSQGVLCCSCQTIHTAPARLRLRCTHCRHFACASCLTPFCCSCHKPWFPGDSPDAAFSNRLRGGARSTKSSKKGSGASSSSSSGPGSLATAHSERASPDPFVAISIPVNPTQSSNDEIDAFADTTVRLATVTAGPLPDIRSAGAPTPSSNLPGSSAPVFSRPNPPVNAGSTEDVPTAVPSRAPSRAASIASAVSTGDAGIAALLQIDPFPLPSEPPALADVIGRVHRNFPLASLKVDEEDPRHFLSRDNTRADEIANDVDHLLSANTSWASLFFFVRDILKFEAIKDSASDFHAFLNGIADIWSDAADFDARGLVSTALDAARYLPKAEKEIDRLEGVAARYKSERKSAREQLRTTEAELSRLRQAANDTLDSNARLLVEIDQLRATDAIAVTRERDEARAALNDVVAHSKTAMSKQISRYQHLLGIADDRSKRIQELDLEAKEKDEYIVKTEQEHAAIYRERETAERQITALKQQLQDATSLFETAREAQRHDQEDFNERSTAFKKHISDLNARLHLLPSGEAELRSLVTDANERAGIAEEEYRKKSTELKAALKEIESLKSKLTAGNKSSSATDKPAPSSKPAAGPNKTVRWSFEPNDDTPNSQPFWDHSNEYSKYIASMVAATVSAIPQISMQTAISSAIDTVRAAGPSILSQVSKPTATNKTTARPSVSNAGPTSTTASSTKSTSNPAARAPAQPRSRAPSPSLAKIDKPATMTFAQMAASVLEPPGAASLHPAKAKPSWRAIETNKSLVLRPGTKGTRVSELHIRVPKVPATSHLFSLSGTKLINEILRLVNESHDKDGIRALKDNHLVLVKWSMRGNLIFKCSKPMDDVIKNCLHEAIKSAVPPSSTDSIAILNKPPTTALKFMTVPRHNEDGTDTDNFDLHNDLMANELWREVEIFSPPRFLPMKPDAAGGTVIVSVVDDNVGSVGRKLMNSTVSFSGASRRCLRWVEKEAQLHCTQCQCWGHLSFNCLSNIMRCSKCAEPHDYRQHDRYCETCKAGKGKLCIPKCHNCHGPHFASSKDCVFFLNRSSKERQVQLRDEFSQKWKEEAAARKAASNTDSGRAARTAIAGKLDNASDAKGKNKAKAKPSTKLPKDDDDFIPVGKSGKAKYTFGGMAAELVGTARIDTVDDNDENQSNASSDLRLSYLDDIPLKQRFPSSKPPAAKPAAPLPPSPPAAPKKPLTITLPASGGGPALRSVTDILRELKAPTKSETVPVTKPIDVSGARFGGGEVLYSASALQAEADAFASALDAAGLASQPSLPPSLDPKPDAPSSHSPTNTHA